MWPMSTGGPATTEFEPAVEVPAGSDIEDGCEPPPSRLSRVWSACWPLLLIAAAVVVVWARPVLLDFNSARLSNAGDSVSFEFYLNWNVHAVLNGQNPFFTPNMYAPRGLDLGNAISVPTVSLLVAPVTLLVGTTAAYNTAFLLAIFLAAGATYLLARELGAPRAGAVVAGLLMVLNPYFVGHSLSHFNLMWIFGLPLVAYLFLRHLHGRLSPLWFVLGTSVVVAFTFGASTELAVTQVFFGGVALLAALLVGPRRPLLRATGWLAAGGALGGVFSLPVIWAAFSSGIPAQPFNPPWLYSTDLLNVFAPTRMFLLTSDAIDAWSLDWLGNDAENTAYLPLTLIGLTIVLVALTRRRLTVVLACLALLALIMSFGPALVVDGTPHGWMPWALTGHVPGLDHALPSRFSTFAFLAIVLIVAVAWPRSFRGQGIVGVVVLATMALLLPNFSALTIPTAIVDRDFVRSGALREVVRPNEIALVLPGGQEGSGLSWVTESDFYFRVPTGNGGGASVPPSLKTPVGLALFQQDEAFPYDGRLAPWAKKRQVSVVLVPETEEFYSEVATREFGEPDRTLDGVHVWRLDGEAPSASR